MPNSISQRRIKVLGRSSTQTIFSDVRTFLDPAGGRGRAGANRHIAPRRLLYRERGGGGESETPSDLQSVEGTWVLLLIGGVLFLSGQGFLSASFLQGTQGTVATIPAGPAWFYVYAIKVLGSSRVSGQFADLAGDVVNLYVFGERQYEVYAFIGLGRSLFSANGSSA